jgi:hypothetical protein
MTDPVFELSRSLIDAAIERCRKNSVIEDTMKVTLKLGKTDDLLTLTATDVGGGCTVAEACAFGLSNKVH